MAWTWLSLHGVISVLLLIIVSRDIEPTAGARPTVRRGHIVSSVAEEFPFVVLLVGKGSFCTGSLISPRTILSAGHCACSQNRLRHAMLNTLSIYDQRQGVRVSRRIVHHDYHSACEQKLRYGHSHTGVGDTDVALFRLKSALTSRPSTSVGQLDFADKVSVGTKVVVAGYGVDEYESHGRDTGVLKWGSMQTVQCMARGRYGPICVPYESYQNAAPGDSGGPLMRPESKEIVGTVSGHRSYSDYKEVVFVPVLPHKNFIRQYM